MRGSSSMINILAMTPSYTRHPAPRSARCYHGTLHTPRRGARSTQVTHIKTARECKEPAHEKPSKKQCPFLVHERDFPSAQKVQRLCKLNVNCQAVSSVARTLALRCTRAHRTVHLPCGKHFLRAGSPDCPGGDVPGIPTGWTLPPHSWLFSPRLPVTLPASS